MTDIQLSKNFWLSEVIKSQTATRRNIDNTPTDQHLENIRQVINNVMQPIRDHFGLSVIITSGYRSPELNKAVNGSSTSDHCSGCAIDFEIPGISNYDVAYWIANKSGLKFSQLILEGYTKGQPSSGWNHISFNPSSSKQQQVLTATFVNGKASYAIGLHK